MHIAARHELAVTRLTEWLTGCELHQREVDDFATECRSHLGRPLT